MVINPKKYPFDHFQAVSPFKEEWLDLPFKTKRGKQILPINKNWHKENLKTPTPEDIRRVAECEFRNK
jgi:hypothetical protein